MDALFELCCRDGLHDVTVLSDEMHAILADEVATHIIHQLV